MPRLLLPALAALLPVVVAVPAIAEETPGPVVATPGTGAALPATVPVPAVDHDAPGATQDASWIMDYRTGLARARATGRPILLLFTGSDWCPWCQRLEREVFHTPAFTHWAAGHVILVMADFPQQTQLPAAIAGENEALAKRWGIDGFPTVLLLTPQEQVLGRLGYLPGGPTPWIRQANAVLQALSPAHEDGHT